LAFFEKNNKIVQWIYSNFVSTKFDNRIEMLKNIIPANGVYAELGVFDGAFSREIIDTLNPKSLILIDYFHGEIGSGDQDGNNFRTIDLNNKYYELLKEYKNDSRVTIIKGDCTEELNRFSNNYFDMIYIDADHSYEGCKKDLNESYKKIKNGGWILGHDYALNPKKTKNKWDFGVKRAVDQFCIKQQLSINAKALDGCVSYGIQIVGKEL